MGQMKKLLKFIIMTLGVELHSFGGLFSDTAPIYFLPVL